MRRWAGAAVPGIAAAATNFWYYLTCDPVDWYFPDSFTYLAPARNLLRGFGFVTEPGLPETLRTPGYPLILAAFGTRADAVIVAQHLANVVLAIAIYFVARRYAGELTALAAGLVFAVDVPTMHYANKVLSETFFTLVLFAAFALIAERRLLPLAALLCGVLVLIRPVAIAYFFALALRERKRLVLLIVLANALPLAWAVRNWAQTDVFTISHIGDVNLMSWRAAGVLALNRGGDFDRSIAVEQQRLQQIADAQIRAAEGVDDVTEIHPAVRARYYGRLGRRILLQHPIALAALTLRGLAVNLFDSRWDALLEPFDEPPETLLRVLVVSWTFTLFALAAIGAIALWRTQRHFAILLVSTIAYFVLISAGGESESRFRVPIIPQYAILAGAGITSIARRLTRSG